MVTQLVAAGWCPFATSSERGLSIVCFVLQGVGRAGSALPVVSLPRGRMVRLRTLNPVAAYCAALVVWPVVAMTAAVDIIDLVHLGPFARRRSARSTQEAAGPV